MATGPTGFFSPKSEKIGKQTSLLDTGGEPFLAVTVALVDILSRPSLHGGEVLSKMSDSFWALPANANRTLSRFTVPEQMGAFLTQKENKEQILASTAQLLLQLAYHEMCKKPSLYCEVFAHVKTNTSLADLYERMKQHPRRIIQALAHVLGVRIITYVKEKERELWARSIEGNSSSRTTLEVQIQGSAIYPRIKHVADFSRVNRLASLPGLFIDENNAMSLVQVLNKLNQAVEQFDREYQVHRKQLSTMLAAGEIDFLLLVELFAEFLPDTTSVGSFASAKEKSRPIATELSTLLQAKERMMVEALSAGLTSGQINAEVMFERVEQRSPSVSSRL